MYREQTALVDFLTNASKLNGALLLDYVQTFQRCMELLTQNLLICVWWYRPKCALLLITNHVTREPNVATVTDFTGRV